METSYDRTYRIALQTPGSEEYHSQVSAAERRIEDAAGVPAMALYASDGLSLSAWHGNTVEIALPLRERNASVFSSILFNGNARGMILMLTIEKSGSLGSGIIPRLQLIDPISFKPSFLHEPCSPIVEDGSYHFLFHADYDPSLSFFHQVIRVPVPPVFRVSVEYSGQTPIIYGVSYALLV